MKESAIGSTSAEGVVLAFTAISGLLLSGGVIVCFVYLLLTVVSMVTLQPVFAQTAPFAAGVRLQAGIEKEDVDGDLKSAMEIYQKIAADTLAPRDVRAQALLRLAGCDEKLGKQAKQVYEQIVHDYADMPAAAQARNRLALLKQQEHPALPVTISARKIEVSGLGRIDVWDTDGERGVHRAADGSLYFGDLAGHSKRLVFKAAPGDSLDWQPSIDFSMVLINLQKGPGSPSILAVVNIDGTGYRELIHDDAQRTILGRSGSMYWSWDKHSVVLTASNGGSDSRLSIASVADGKRRELAHIVGSYISKTVFSPDGRFIAYEVMPDWGKSELQSGTCRIFIVPVNGGESHLVYESRTWKRDSRFSALKDWTANGRYLAIKDIDFSGRSALYLLPMKDGAAGGAAELVRYGEFVDGYTTSTGSLVYQEPSTKRPGMSAFHAALGPEGKVENWQRLDLRGGGLDEWRNRVSFSPNGTGIAYLAPSKDGGVADVVLRELSSGIERVLYKSANEHVNCAYANSSPTIFCLTSKNDEKTDLISIDLGSGTVKRLASLDGQRSWLQHSLDDSRFYFTSDNPPASGSVLQWDSTSQKETTLATRSNNVETYAPSPDGNWLIRTGMSTDISVRPISGGDWKSLASGINGIWWQNVVAPDGKWLYYHSTNQAGKDLLFRISIVGGQPELVGDFPCTSFSGYLNISTDGRQILATCLGKDRGDAAYDLWVLENYEPVVKN